MTVKVVCFVLPSFTFSCSVPVKVPLCQIRVEATALSTDTNTTTADTYTKRRRCIRPPFIFLKIAGQALGLRPQPE